MSLNLNDLLAEMERSAGLEKSASTNVQTEIKPSVSDELASVLTKKASEDLTKVAFAEGEALAKQLLTKLATNIQLDNAIMQAEDDKKVTPTSQGTVSEVLQDTIDKGVAAGGQSDDLVDEALDKEAQLTLTENQTMAKSIMQKIAQMVGEPTTTPAAAINVQGAPVPNQIQMANAEMTAFDDAKVQPMPGTEGTINNILEAIVAKAKAQGGGSDDLVNGEGPMEGSASLGSPADMQEKAAAVSALVDEGLDFDTAINMVKQAEAELYAEASEHEKIAAVNALVEEGMDFDSAIELVKQAEYEIAVEEDEMEKKAAFDYLVSEGVDFDEAAEMIKEAAEVTRKASNSDVLAMGARATGRGYLESIGGGIGGAALGAGAGALAIKTKAGRNAAATILKNYKGKGIKKGKEALMAGGAALGLAGGSNAGMLHGSFKSTRNSMDRHVEKQAAFEALTSNGVTFEDAIELVKQAELEVYGE